MSVWPQAAWIVRKLQQNFDAKEDIYNYTSALNNISNKVDTQWARLQIEIQQYNNRLVTVAANNNGNKPKDYTDNQFENGAIWFVTV